MIKAVIFDADGPLYYRTKYVTLQKQNLLKEFGYSGDLKNFEDVYEVEKFKAYVQAETVAEMFQNILASIGLKVSSQKAQEFTDKFNSIQCQVTATADSISTLMSLKDQVIKICILTDSFYSAEEKRPWFKNLGMSTFIDCIVSSYDIKQLKDTPEAYHACLEALKISPKETVFVGHQQYEMVGAQKSGIKSVAVLPISTPNIQADYTIDKLSELPSLIEKIN